MKVAIVDMGTNTFNLLIQDTSSGEVFFNDKIPVKLGEGGIDDNQIAPPAFERGLQALVAHGKTIRRHEVEATYAFATSAVRSAQNGTDFIAASLERAGIAVNVLSGDEEAALIYYGVRQALDLGKHKSLIVDIGGGSTECIIANAERVFWQKSYPLGSSRLKEHFQPADPLENNDKEAIQAYLKTQLEDLFSAVKTHEPQSLIGSSGSFDTLAAMILARFEQANPLLQGHTSYVFDLGEYRAISRQMLTSGFEERLRTPGMIPMRADMMPMACLLIDFLLNQTGIRSLKLSTYALKEGVSALLKENTHSWQKSLL